MASAKIKLDYEMFRLRFSFNEIVRAEPVRQLEKCNQRLQELLRTSDTITALVDDQIRDHKSEIELVIVFKRSRKTSKPLFSAIERSWHCACQQSTIIKNVIRLLEICQEHFKVANISR